MWELPYEPPERVLDAWRAALRRRQPLGVPEVLALASLSERQLSGLARLGPPRGVREGVPQIYRPSLREFLDLFAGANARTRLQLLGTGASVHPVQGSAMLLKPFTGKSEGRPLLLRLAQKVERDELSDPPGWTVTLSLVRKWPEETSQMAFTFMLPQ
jgi:hypothetical protein